MKKSYTYIILAFLSMLLFIVAMPVNAYKYQTTDSIKETIKEFLLVDTDVNNFTIGNLDKRLRLKQCASRLNTNFPQYAETIGRTTVAVSCDNPKPWKILVSVYIKKFVNILAAKHSMPAGTVITDSDLTIMRTDISRLRNGYFTRISQLKNTIVRRPIKTGKIINPAMLKPKQLVMRGDEVLILAQTNNLKIRVKGKALMNGILGQRIRVKNMSSKRVFQATVISNGLVKVSM